LSFARCHIKLLREPGTLALVVDVGLAYEMRSEREKRRKGYFLILQKSKRTEFIIHKGISALSSYYMKSQAASARLLCCTQYMECNTLGCTQLSVAERRPGNKLISNCVHRSFPSGLCCALNFSESLFAHGVCVFYVMRISDVHCFTHPLLRYNRFLWGLLY
jgi:hypothetical protein